MNASALLYLYTASAGSGKTFALVVRYLSMILSSNTGYRSVLAVTFTNKATAEIKERILKILYQLARKGSGVPDANNEAAPYLAQLSNLLGTGEQEICKRAATVLRNLLIEYSFFSVHTIDSFFQRILREFARETGLPFGYAVELDNRQAIIESVDKLLAETTPGEPLFRHLVAFTRSFSEEGKWDIRSRLIREGAQVFQEDFRNLVDPDPLKKIHELQKELDRIVARYEATIKEYGNKGNGILQKHHLTPEDFYQKRRSAPMAFSGMASGNFKPNSYFAQAVEDPDKLLSSNEQSLALITVAKTEIHPLLVRIAGYYRAEYPKVVSAKLLRHTLFVYGIQLMLRKYVHQWIREENRFLIGEVNRFLRDLIGNNELPFIYEKIGQHFRHFLIDEFQDTSRFQYENFRPLILDALARGDDSMVVGDIKQSIYRWRNSDWTIMVRDIPGDIPEEQLRQVPLTTNFRSRKEIVRFNNRFFLSAPETMSAIFREKVHKTIDKSYLLDQPGLDEHTDLIPAVYDPRELVQEVPEGSDTEGGYVAFRFLDNEDGTWKERATFYACQQVETLIRDGFSPRDIALLVRTNDEGTQLVNALIHWQEDHHGCPAFPVISDDALTLSQSASVRMIIHFLRWIIQPGEPLAFATFYYDYYRVCEHRPADPVPPDGFAGKSPRELWETYLPELDPDIPVRLTHTPLHDMVREAAKCFGLLDIAGEIPFLYALEHNILDHLSEGGTGISSFLDWWDQKGQEGKIPMPEGVDAVRVMTIFKAKGLGMEVVLLPYADWEFEKRGNRSSDIIWARPEEHPFNLLPELPVPVKSEMVHSLFRRAYLSEKTARYIDNLNLLYVAFTRAINQLYVFTNSKSTAGNTGDLIGRVVSEPQWDSVPRTSSGTESGYADRIMEFGKYETKGSRTEQPLPETIQVLHGTGTYGKLKFRTTGRDFFVLEKTGAAEQINRGNLYHHLFERIKTTQDVETAVVSAVKDGMISKREKDEYLKKIYEFLKQPEVSEWFDGSWEVFNERTFISANGRTFRPDRVMVREGRAWVVDYKTGEEESRYAGQVKRYMNILYDLGFKPVRGTLWNPVTGRIVHLDPLV